MKDLQPVIKKTLEIYSLIIKKLSSDKAHLVLILLIILVGGFFRFYNLNWDNGLSYHPDELNVMISANKVNIPDKLDPDFFAYGGFPIYLYKGTAQVVSTVTNDITWKTDIAKVNIIGRTYSAIFSTLTIILIYLFTRKVFNKRAALFAALLASFCVGFIQDAHYSVTESMLVFFLMLISLISVDLIKGNKTYLWCIMALVCGLAIGSKTASIAFLSIPGTVWLINFFKNRKNKLALIHHFIKGLGFLFVTAVIAFAVSPYTLIGLERFQSSMTYEGGVVAGTVKVPYTWQFFDTLPYVYPFTNMMWHTSIILPIVGFIAILLCLFLIIKKKETIYIFPLIIFSILYFVYTGGWYAKFIRYMLPMLPIIIILSAWLIDKLISSIKFKKVGKILLLLVVSFSIIWVIAFMSIYTTPQTRFTASEWIYNNIPSGSVVLKEHWDYSLPHGIKGLPSKQYTFLEMKNYDPENRIKFDTMSDNLARGDYMILSSKRLVNSIGQQPKIYPLTSKYYTRLFEEQLGYTLVQKISSYPHLGPIELSDEKAEETFEIFDHPTVYIFKNDKHYPKDKLFNILYN
ncbi:MAG: glycosyltransferase family 39 protein [bacterium]